MATGESESDRTGPLRGARILVIEDEYYIADDFRRVLTDAGAQVVGPVSTLSTANEAIDRGEFDCAVVDLNLHGQSAACCAERLLKEGKSFAIATGYGSDSVPETMKAIPRIEKPFDPPELLRLVRQLRCARPGEIA
jgi:DNA-binding NtrC family response regulator